MTTGPHDFIVGRPLLGRSLMLTPELREELCAHLAQGAPIKTACQAVGISKPTYYSWGDVAHARHGPQVTAGVASLAAGHSGIRPPPEPYTAHARQMVPWPWAQKPLGAARPRPSERSRPVNWSGGTFGCVVKLPCLTKKPASPWRPVSRRGKLDQRQDEDVPV